MRWMHVDMLLMHVEFTPIFRPTCTKEVSTNEQKKQQECHSPTAVQ